ncbi:MAG TPA: winged helix-turn-helix domain-containing protein [Paludibaculum sp.]|jgi:TolB-like protein
MYEFHDFRYDEEQRLLFRHGVLCPMEPKALETLHALIVRRGQVVEKAELMRLVWPDTVVEDVGLARNISLLRKALGEQAGACIETIPKRGYRFVVEEAVAPPVAAPPVVNARTAWPRWLAAMGLLVALAGVVYWQFYRPSRFLGGGERLASLAVIPLETLSPEWESVALARGLSERLVVELAKPERTYVVSPGTVRRYQWVGISPAMMGRMLGLDVLVEGAVQRAGGRVNVSARLVDVHSGKMIWADNIDRPSEGAAEAQTEMARQLAAQIGERLAR